LHFDSDLLNDAVSLAEEHMKRLHEMPEKAFSETDTTAYIRSICERYRADGTRALDIIDIGMETGLVCYLDAGCDETIALRADIDAVPTEQGPKHLCGHDAHAAALLGAMHYLTSAKDELKHNVLFIFQPAEEGTRGARAMLKHGLFEKAPDKPIRIFGIHNRPEIYVGDVVLHRGALMSEKSIYKVVFKGKPGHGAKPHKCIDPIPAAASFVEAVQTIISRNINPLHPAICTVNSIKAGEPDVPVAETAVITGYIRSFSHDTHSLMEERIKALAEGTAAEYRCKNEVEIIPMVPAVVNSDDMYDLAYKAAEQTVGTEHITDSEPDLASEDFAVYGEIIPSFFYWVGSGEPGKDSPSWHDENFRIGKDYLKTAVPLLAASVLI
jgi:hippurate hydrolase